MAIAFFIGFVIVVTVTLIISVTCPDRVVVMVIYRLNLNVYPMARQIAGLLYNCPEQWTSDRFHLRHPKLGAIWIANEAYGLKIESEFGDLMLNMIERRIIRDAVDWRLRQYIRDRLTLVLTQPIEKRRIEC